MLLRYFLPFLFIASSLGTIPVKFKVLNPSEILILPQINPEEEIIEFKANINKEIDDGNDHFVTDTEELKISKGAKLQLQPDDIIYYRINLRTKSGDVIEQGQFKFKDEVSGVRNKRERPFQDEDDSGENGLATRNNFGRGFGHFFYNGNFGSGFERHNVQGHNHNHAFGYPPKGLPHGGHWGFHGPGRPHPHWHSGPISDCHKGTHFGHHHYYHDDFNSKSGEENSREFGSTIKSIEATTTTKDNGVYTTKSNVEETTETTTPLIDIRFGRI